MGVLPQVRSPTAPLSIFAIAPDGLSDSPLRGLSTIHSAYPTPYALCSLSTSSSAGSSPHLLLSGWFDGHVHLNDLRLKDVKPVITCNDPWLDDAVYSLSSCSDKVVAGMAQHGIVAIFDVRAKHMVDVVGSTLTRRTKVGFSVYSPEGDGSPVYAIHAESARIWGLNRSLFLLDFGSDDLHHDRSRLMYYDHSIRYITQA